MIDTNQLIIVAGPSASGKTTLINEIRQGNHSKLHNHISELGTEKFRFINAIRLSKVTRSFIPRLCVHYDFLRQHNMKRGFLVLPDLIPRSKSVKIVTLCAPAHVLSERISSRLELLRATEPLDEKRIKGQEYKRRLYNSKHMLLRKYMYWVSFAQRSGTAEHLIINTADDNRVFQFCENQQVRKNIENMLFGTSHWTSPPLGWLFADIFLRKRNRPSMRLLRSLSFSRHSKTRS